MCVCMVWNKVLMFRIDVGNIEVWSIRYRIYRFGIRGIDVWNIDVWSVRYCCLEYKISMIKI